MHQRMKKGLAAMLSVVFVASLLLNSFSIGVFALNEQDTMAEQIVAQLEEDGVSAEPDTETPEVQPEETPAVSAVPTQQPEATEEPVESAQPELAPSETAMPEHAVTPEPTETPEPTAAPEVTATPESAVTPAPIATAMPEQMNEEELKQQIEELLEQSYSLTEMTEEELEENIEEINAISAMPMTQSSQEDSELQDLMKQLADAQAAMEDMRMAWQAKREGWLDQLPQTGKENSWRYQNGTRIDEDEISLNLDLPDGVSTFSADCYWGIDVSHHQGVINWDAVKSAGIDFAIIRCGYGMDLTEQDDKQWSRNVSECERLGIPYGVYFYSYAVTADMAVEEGAHAVRLLQGHNPDLPVFYDMEENRQLVVGNSGLAELARIFCDIVSSKGYEVGVYASLNWWNYYLTDAVFENWYRWIAEWRSSCHYNGRYEMWQYTDAGTLDGINGYVDMNYWYGDLPGKKESIARGVYTIAVSLDTSKVLDVSWNSTENGANIELFSYNGGANQHFNIVPCGDGYYNIINVNSGKALDVDAWGSQNVIQWDQTGGDNQKWSFEYAGNGMYYIRSKSAGKYLDVNGGYARDGANVGVFGLNNGGNQKFELKRVLDTSISNGTYTIQSSMDRNKVLDIENHGTENGSNVELFTANGGLNQQFEFIQCWDGYYIIRNTNSGKVLDMDGWGSGNVMQWDDHDADNQKWGLESAGDGAYYIRSKSSGLYLDVNNNQTADKTNIGVFAFNGGANQKFYLDRKQNVSGLSGVYYITSSLDESKVLDIEMCGMENGANVELFTRNNGDNQKFELIENSDGTYSIRNVNSQKMLDVDGWGSHNVLQWEMTGGNNQKWILEPAGNNQYYIRSKNDGLYLDIFNRQTTDKTNIETFTFNGGENQKFRLVK